MSKGYSRDSHRLQLYSQSESLEILWILVAPGGGNMQMDLDTPTPRNGRKANRQGNQQGDTFNAFAAFKC